MIEDQDVTTAQEPPRAYLCISECERHFEVKNRQSGEILCLIEKANVSLCQHFMYRHEENTVSADEIMPIRLDNGGALAVYTSARLSGDQENAVTLDFRGAGGTLEMTERDVLNMADMLDNYTRLLNKRRQRNECSNMLHGRWLIRIEKV